MLTFVGKGYTPEFTANYRRIAERLTAGEGIRIVAGPDDVCAPLLGGADPHCFGDSVVTRDANAAEAVGRLIGQPVMPGLCLTPDAVLLSKLRAAFARQTLRPACSGCEWSSLCTAIAEDGYAGTLVTPA